MRQHAQLDLRVVGRDEDVPAVRDESPPDFTPEVLRDWRDDSAELFENEWDTVEILIGALKSFGIYYFDAKPGNILFAS